MNSETTMLKHLFVMTSMLCGSLGVSHPSFAVSPPNVVVFLVDDMGVMDTSVPFLTDDAGRPKRCPLNEFYRTPNMERLAAIGIRFNQSYHYFPSQVSGNSHYQLFHLADDPFEQSNLAAVRPDQLRRMMQGLITAMEAHSAVYPVAQGGQVQKPKLP